MALFTVQGPRALPQGGATFPTLPGLLGRWRADVGVTLSGSNVTAVADQSGNGNNLVNSGTVPWSATGYTGSLGSKPAFVFAAANEAALFCSSFPIGTGNTVSVFCIGQMGSGTEANGGLVVYGTAGTNDYNNIDTGAFLIRDATNAILDSERNGVIVGQNCSTNVNHRMGHIDAFAANTRIVYVDNAGGTPGTQIGNFATNGTLVIGQRWLGGSIYNAAAWDGAICEIFIGNADWTANLNDIDTYLTAQWGS